MDELFSYPWNCGDRDCPTQWHCASVWANPDDLHSFDVCSFNDGDVSYTIDESELMSADEIAAAWRQYHQYIADTGNDPIGDLYVPREEARHEHLDVIVRDWIGNDKHGPRIEMWRKHGSDHWLEPHALSKPAQQFLCTSKANKWGVAGFECADAIASAPNVLDATNTSSGELAFCVKVDSYVPRDEELVRAELKAKALEIISR